jgi:putative chitinase
MVGVKTSRPGHSPVPPRPDPDPGPGHEADASDDPGLGDDSSPAPAIEAGSGNDGQDQIGGGDNGQAPGQAPGSGDELAGPGGGGGRGAIQKTLRTGFGELQVKMRKVMAGRRVIGADIQLALDHAGARAGVRSEDMRTLGPQLAASQAAPPRRKFDRNKFFQGYTHTLGRLDHSQQTGLNALLTAAEADPGITDIRWLAYMLATVMHECARKWRPIEEYGKGKGRPYGKPVTVTDPQGNKHTNVYYGRGYVQLTLKSNYENMGKLLKIPLLYRPELALQPAVAYKIMSLGMRRGLFTRKKLADYIRPGGKADYVNARQIINGHDRAQLIAGYASRLERILRQSAVGRPPAHRPPKSPPRKPVPGRRPGAPLPGGHAATV